MTHKYGKQFLNRGFGLAAEDRPSSLQSRFGFTYYHRTVYLNMNAGDLIGVDDAIHKAELLRNEAEALSEALKQARRDMYPNAEAAEESGETGAASGTHEEDSSDEGQSTAPVLTREDYEWLRSLGPARLTTGLGEHKRVETVVAAFEHVTGLKGRARRLFYTWQLVVQLPGAPDVDVSCSFHTFGEVADWLIASNVIEAPTFDHA